MKQIYFKITVVLVFIAASIPQHTNAQCTCAGGVPATTIRNVVVLAPTNAPSATISFPQFNPTILTGFDLACAAVFDTLSGMVTSGARNLNSSTALLDPANSQYSATGRMAYAFILPVTANVVGPGFVQSKSFTTNYGPDSLGAYLQPDDTITYGPDPLINNYAATKSITSISSYIGSGTVSLSYNILGNLVATQGSLNFAQKVTATYWGSFGLMYYLCPSSPLATSISYFSAIKNKNTVDLQWLAANFENNTQYEIQISTNGQDFGPIGNVAAGSASAGTITEYHYQYDLNQTDIGALYFRIKRIEGDGHASYSAVKLINLISTGSFGIQTYPNPVVRNVKIQFSANQTGHFTLELISLSGQIIQQKSITMNGNNQIDFDLDNHPARGLYILRAKDVSQNKQYITKVQVQ